MFAGAAREREADATRAAADVMNEGMMNERMRLWIGNECDAQTSETLRRRTEERMTVMENEGLTSKRALVDVLCL